jgi:hypothetical protein
MPFIHFIKLIGGGCGDKRPGIGLQGDVRLKNIPLKNSTAWIQQVYKGCSISVGIKGRQNLKGQSKMLTGQECFAGLMPSEY